MMLYETNEIYNLPARVSIVIDRLRLKVHQKPNRTWSLYECGIRVVL